MSGKIAKIVTLVLCLVMVAMAQQNNLIIGTWAQESGNVTWTFRANGSGLMERGEPRTTAHFKWSIEGRTLQVTTPGTSLSYRIVEVDEKNLIIENEHVGRSYRLFRR